MTDPEVEGLLRDLAPQVLGVLSRRYGDFDGAEDAVQEALIAAHRHWPGEGMPDNPRGWLLQTAGRRLVDAYRSDATRRAREERVALEDADAGPALERDDSLTVLFLACHPSLTPVSAVALILRAVAGLTTAEIARAFLVTEATMGQRISRAKQTIMRSGARFELPSPDEQCDRLPSVLRVLYLIFNEGYGGDNRDDDERVELAGEAIQLARMVHRLVPEHLEGTALLALMLLLDARAPARSDGAGRLVPLPDQDRSRWSARLIAEGTTLLDGVVGRGPVGEYQLQAAIAAVHDRAPRAEETDWPQILALYELLERITDNPVVTLNRAVAVAMAGGPLAGLALVAEVEPRLPGHPRLLAVRAHLEEMAGDLPAAHRDFRAAAQRTTNRRERDHLITQAARLSGQRPTAPGSLS